MNNLRPQLKWRLIGVLGKWFIDLLFATIRITFRGQEEVKEILASKKFMFVLWHSRILPVSYTHKGFNAAIMVSPSEDGEIIAQTIHRQGHIPLRGSSTRGGQEALFKILELLKQKARPGVIIPDGPLGPRFKVKNGVIQLAKQCGYPVVACTGSASRLKIFASWDRFVIPWPFSRCLIIYGKPIYIPPNITLEEAEIYRQIIENEMNRITKEADSFFGYNIT